MRKYNLLSVQALTAGYRPRVDVLHEVDVDVDEHEIVTILGSNGAGKSSLLLAVSGLLSPTAGKIRFAGEEIGGLSAHEVNGRDLALVPSGRQMFSAMTVEENLLVGAHRFRREKSRARRLLKETYARIPELGSLSRRPAGQLSGGQQQLVSIARGLMSAPRLLMLDEPSMGLDPIAVSRVAEVITELRDEGMTLLLVEKLAHLATSLSDRIVVLQHGRVVLSGPATDLAGDQRVEAAYLGSPGISGGGRRSEA